MALRRLTTNFARTCGRPARILSATLLAGFLLVGCAVTADLDPQITPPADSDRIPMAVGVYYGPELRAYEYTTVPSRRMDEVIVPLGEASVSLFQNLLPGIFETVVEIDGRPTASEPIAGLDAVIEPQIEAFTLRALDVGGWWFWADIRYRFTIRAVDGSEIASWTVRGDGANVGARMLPSWESIANTVDLALEVAATRLVASFEEVPEAARWRREQPGDTAIAAATGQVTQSRRENGGYPLRGTYERIVAISADPYRPPDLSAEGIEADPRDAGAHSFLLEIKNLGNRRLLIRRPEITLAFSNGATIEPVSGAYLAAALTTKKTRMGLISSNAGPQAAIAAAVVNLAILLYNYSAYESETAEATVYGLVYDDNELTDAFLDGQQRIEGYVHFFVPPDLRALAVETATLIVPVVELDTVTRYIVSLPLGARDLSGKQDVSE
jgi:hypothetical protein